MGRLRQIMRGLGAALPEWRPNPRQREWVAVALMGVAGLMLLDVAYQVGMHVRWRYWLSEVKAEAVTTRPAGGEAATSAPSTQPGSTRPAGPSGPKARGPRPLAPPPGAASEKPKRNIFTEPPQKGHNLRLTGVIGATALFANKEGNTIGLEVGKSANGLTVKSIDGYTVVTEYEGKTETMKLFGEGGGPGPGEGPVPAMGPGPGAGPGPGFRPGPGGMPPEMMMRRRR